MRLKLPILIVRACLKSIAPSEFRSSPIFIALLFAASSTYRRGYASSVLSPVHINLDNGQNSGGAILFKHALRVFLLGTTLWASLSCGVKGDPLPPEKPAPLGRGQPSYKRATEELAFPSLPPVEEDDIEDEDKESEEEDE